VTLGRAGLGHGGGFWKPGNNPKPLPYQWKGAGQIVKAHADGTLVYQWMGRNGGKGGNLLAGDIVSGGWREQSYEVRRDLDPTSHNWLLISEFIAKTSKS
jgi:hypothetical protein